MSSSFLQNTTLITYSPDHVSKAISDNIKDLVFNNCTKEVYWLNTYGLNHIDDMKQVVLQNQFDDFLIKLFHETNHANKVIELDNVLFIAVKVLKSDEFSLSSEQMIFVMSSNMLWSIQEYKGGYFEWIRDRLVKDKGLIRRKNVDYLLFLLLESLIASYDETFQNILSSSETIIPISKINPTPYFTENVEQQKCRLMNFKKATLSLRNTIVKLQTIDNLQVETKYFIELKEQATNLISDIDFEMLELDSKINLIFSIQGHRLNEIMRMLTLISVVFIPLTFIAGVYGMNFEYMPELKFKYGYFVVLSIMATSAIFSIWYFKSKKWF
ncbi:CorA family divalent cation transporter [Psychrobacter sp.]|uniref:CorA family divalent cation transporter n=1 Tax=Psychrobacter sp. TaxID=56811 RepID=UPI0025FA5452|nr:CorA family divalent cation transporter [Psychrobacter sp.]